MALYKESMLNKIEDDLAGRNQNWDKLEGHLVEKATDDVHGLANAVIVESGSNANGSWIRFGDGLQICYKKRVITNEIDAGSVCTEDWAYPKEFSEIPFVIPSKLVSTNNAYLIDVGMNYSYVTSSTARIVVKNTYSGTVAVRVDVFAIGRWKLEE